MSWDMPTPGMSSHMPTPGQLRAHARDHRYRAARAKVKRKAQDSLEIARILEAEADAIEREELQPAVALQAAE
jgi:hypothetical protein